MKTVSVGFVPAWRKYEEGMKHPDSKDQVTSGDKFVAERKHELETNPQAKRWETGRKKAWDSAKPAYVKKQIEEVNAPLKKIEDAIRNVGKFESNITPTPGFVIIEPDIKEEKAESGIYMPENTADANTGTVIEIGTTLQCKHCFISNDVQPTQPPAKKGDRVLYKLGAGINLQIKEKKCKLMMFGDLLGIFHD